MRSNEIVKLDLVFLSAIVGLCAFSDEVLAQIGPDLRPPGLGADISISSFEKTDERTNASAAWDLDTEGIVFSAAKKRQLISEAPSTIHIISSRDIAVHGWRTLPEILRHVPGVQVIASQSQFYSVMIRGLVGTENNNSRILWLQNGVPMNDVRDSGIWIDETYPVELIQRIEVILGPGSALYGSGAFQGVVNIFTKDPGVINKYGEYRAALLNNMTIKTSAIAAYQSEDKTFGVLGHVSANSTQGPGLVGDYVYQNYLMDQANASFASSQDYNKFHYSKIDSNSDKHWYNINFKLNYKIFKWNLGFTDIYAGADGSEIVPNIVYDQPVSYTGDLHPDATSIIKDEAVGISDTIRPYRFNRRELFSDFFLETSFADTVSFIAVLSYRFLQYHHKHYGGLESDKYLARYAEIDADSGQVSWKSASRFEGKINYDTFQHKLYGLAQIQWQIIPFNELIAGAVLEYHHIESPDFLNGNPMLFDISNSDTASSISHALDARKIGYLTPSVFVQDEQRLWNDRIILTAGVRFDAYKATYDFDPAPSWRFAFLMKCTNWFTLRASYGYAYKEPSLYQLYVDTFDYVGNSELKNETLHNAELSLMFFPLHNMRIRADGFATFMSDLIIMENNEKLGDPYSGITGRFYPNQENDAQLYGFELSIESAIDSWKLYGHYNFLYSKQINEGKSINIPEDAMHRIKLGASYISDAFTFDVSMFASAGSPKAKSNFNWRTVYSTPAYALLQPQITVALPANLGLMFAGSMAFSKNMFKTPTWKYYYEKEGIPTDRYSFSIALQYPYASYTE